MMMMMMMMITIIIITTIIIIIIIISIEFCAKKNYLQKKISHKDYSKKNNL